MLASIAIQNRRKGFTLVELLVAAALSILIMAIMATAFQTGLGTLSTLKSIGDMAERLKTAEMMLRTDLEAEHFVTSASGDDASAPLRISDLRYDTGASSPPFGGYFKLSQALQSNFEGNDADGLLSSSADGNRAHRISMTVKRQGCSPDQLFTADIPGPNATVPGSDANLVFPAMNITDVTNSATSNIANSRWAQVDWFLETGNIHTVNNVPTWSLIRRVRPIIEDSSKSVILTSRASAESISMFPLTNQVNTLRTTIDLTKRALVAPIPSGDAKFGDDLVITNVTSFEVRPMYAVHPNVPYGAFDGVFADLPGPYPAQYDTASGATGNNRLRVLGVQIKIRVYDPKNKLSRQTTLVVKL